MLRVLVLLLVLAGEPWVRWLFARAGEPSSAPDLHLAALCFVVLCSERWLGLSVAALLALWRAPLGLASPATLLAAYVILALLLLQMRRAFVAAGPITRLALALFVYGAWLVLAALLPGLAAEPELFGRSALTRAFLTIGIVPILLGARAGWLPSSRGVRAVPRPRVVFR